MWNWKPTEFAAKFVFFPSVLKMPLKVSLSINFKNFFNFYLRIQDDLFRKKINGTKTERK